MKKHLTEGELRLAIDGEAPRPVLEHLEGCAACRQRRQSMESRSLRISARMQFLQEQVAPAPSPHRAWQQLSEKILIYKESSMFRKWLEFPVIRYGALAVLMLALFLAFPGGRVLADEFLNLFRVQQVAVIPVDFTGLEQMSNGATGQQFSELISRSIDMTQKPGDPVPVADAAQASQAAGFTARLPQGFSPSQLYVTGSSQFTLTVDRKKAQALLDEAGRSDLVLPDTIDGARISAQIPASVTAAFGTCPEPNSQEGRGDAHPMSARQYPDCVMFAQLPSPTVDAPAGVDVAKLAELGLEFTGMSAEQAQAYTASVDWTSTLVVPIPKNAATYEQIQVDGVTGTLIQRPADDAPQYVLLWVKDGILYAISGLGSDARQAIDMANSLP